MEDKICAPCYRDKLRNSGAIWCEDCKEILCSECRTAHQVNKLTFHHQFRKELPISTEAIPLTFKKSSVFIVPLEERSNAVCDPMCQDMILTRRGEFLLYEDTNDQLILYNSEENCIIGSCKMPIRILKMVCIPGTSYIAMACEWEGVYFMDYKTMKLGKRLHVEGNGLCSSVAVINDKLVVGTQGKLLFYTLSGSFLKCLNVGCRSEYDILSILQGIDNTIICTDQTDILHCLDQKGKELWFYESLEFPSTITNCLVHQNGAIFVGSGNNNVVHQLSPDGMVLNENVLDGCSGGVGMCFNDDFSELYMAESDPVSVVVYKRI